MLTALGAGGRVLRLEVLDYEGPAAWRWRLTETDGGRFVADREVRLDSAAWQFEAFAGLDDYLREHAAPDRRAEDEERLVSAVAEWIGEHVFGPIGAALVERAPVTVRVELPAGAEVLAYRPLELARVEGRPLAVQGVSLVIVAPGGRERMKAAVGDRLRMLAVFSLPVDASALNLRRERAELARLIQRVSTQHGKAVELRIVQYGVTRARLEEVLLEAEGWDVIHISGHGLPSGVLLERADGTHDLVSTAELVALLELVASQLKLVCLSSCDSAALTAAEHLRLLGIEPPPSAEPAGDAAQPPLPALATELAGRLDCAVLAMRYPVGDEFAIALARRLYDLVVGKGQPLPRALALALPRLLDEGGPQAPAISVATPALFGSRAAALMLAPPAGRPAVFDAEQQKLAGFPPAPERFVGRVGPMGRATAVLAPDSGRSGVLLVGMAGAGKSACALELAYTHEQGFERLAWHQAPLDDEDLPAALARCALDLERQLPGLKLVHLVDDRDRLAAFLPKLTEFLERRRVLIVIDNCETLLTAGGDWRDERWRLLVDALAGHSGDSRLVLTSRVRPRDLAAGLLVEPIHALSLAESVLLAREWPNLRALIDGRAAGLDADAARALAARALATVQGHPKLIELADGEAADPAALGARLADAEQAWTDAGATPAGFLRSGEPAAGDDDYLAVLQRWARGIGATLPDASRLLFAYLCCLEPDDRDEPTVGGNWERLWRRLERAGDPPALEHALGPLAEHALVAVERDGDGGTPRTYRLHPAIAAAGRADAGADVGGAVDRELAAWWTAHLADALRREGEGRGGVVVRAGRSALPYLARRQEWRMLAIAAVDVLIRDDSAGAAAALLPPLRRAAELAAGGKHELLVLRACAVALGMLRPDEAIAACRTLLDRAVAGHAHEIAHLVTADAVALLRETQQLGEALVLAEQLPEYARRAGLGPWTQLGDELQRLQILSQTGDHERVLAAVDALRERMASLSETLDGTETITPFHVREVLLDTGRSAALALGRWADALALNAEGLQSKRTRGAAVLELARTEFNDYGPLLSLGRLHDARALLQRCRRSFDQEHDAQGLGVALGALASVEDQFGHGEQAIAFEAAALRYKYAAGQPDQIRVSHFNFANYRGRHGGDPRDAGAHRIAAAVIDYQTSSGKLARALQALATDAHAATIVLELDWQEVCELTGRIEGVDLDALVARLPARAPDGPAALAEVLRLAAEIPPDPGPDVSDILKRWTPVLSTLLAARAGDARATELLDSFLCSAAQTPEWAALSAVLRRLAAGERDPRLLASLDDVDTAIARLALDALDGRAAIDPDAWHALIPPPDAAETDPPAPA